MSKPTEPLSRNRMRFESIHADKRHNSLRKIYQQLLENDNNLGDDQIIKGYLKFSAGIQTNTYAAAELEWVTISTLCYYRPRLTSFLIRRGLLSIVYSLGDEIDANVVFEFIQQRILADGTEPYGGLPHAVGTEWLSEILPTQVSLVQQTLDEVIEQNRRELEEL